MSKSTGSDNIVAINSKSRQPQRKPYKIESATIEARYARGWHCIGAPTEYTEKPVMLDYFGTKLVAYRGEDNQVRVLDGYCPHMGGDLSRGCVEGNSVRCPFHDWRWGADGVCDDIPYAKRIPERAVIKSWPTLEENNLVFVWNDHEGNGPIEEQRPERIDDCFDSEWTPWYLEKMRIDTNCRELIDNMADIAHFGPVHGAPVSKFSNEAEKHIYRQRLEGASERLSEGDKLFSLATYEGPAYMHTYMTGKMEGMDVTSRLLVSHVPVHTECFDLRFGVKVKKDPNLSDEENIAMVKSYVEANRIAFFQDVEVWHTKIRVDNPLMCDGDGPIYKLRQWYQQFYTDIDRVPGTWQTKKVYTVSDRG